MDQPRDPARLFAERLPGAGLLVLGDAVGVAPGVAEGGQGDLAGPGAAQVHQDGAEGPADGRVGAEPGAEDPEARVQPDARRVGAVDDDGRGGEVGRGLEPVEVEDGVARRLHGRQDHREIVGAAAGHHGVDGDLLDAGAAAGGGGEAAMKFADLLKERTQGRINVKNYFAGQLFAGKQTNEFTLLNQGVADFALGYPINMNWGDAQTAFQQGTVDGQENPVVSVIFPYKLWTVHKNISLWSYAIDPLILGVSKITWDSLTPADREMVRKTALEGVDWQKRGAPARLGGR